MSPTSKSNKPSRSKELTTEQMRRIIMRGDGWPHPSYKLAGSGVRFLDEDDDPVQTWRDDVDSGALPRPGEPRAQRS